jgi:hypothetical protein
MGTDRRKIDQCRVPVVNAEPFAVLHRQAAHLQSMSTRGEMLTNRRHQHSTTTKARTNLQAREEQSTLLDADRQEIQLLVSLPPHASEPRLTFFL